ncbi:molybdenum cofactor biosynthesis protein MoaE [Denitratisoma sp. DHT3]|uniref:molybdopterin synthase catalytic subunit MoaE n=1 Tax=Denitratisoma sp. DHT3 TaxID=1981880 RepID=UPI001198BF3D|nr:molybdopterin synthase catalytic subunit MoaE [Denitratisoma sp. DHT3]QDX81024.1 molybdenum cofactor biosynthesis protein MoaE [Denitratisoma sp. DHT3]
MSISVQTEDFDVGAEIAALSAGDAGAGAVASFVGLMRDRNDGGDGSDGGGVAAMTLEHYPGMTERALDEIVAEARCRWELRAVRVIHRVGRLLPGERIVLVAVSSAHRGEAFAACEFIMDYLKTRAPLWKKEETDAGGRWVDARESDEDARRRWVDDAGA